MSVVLRRYPHPPCFRRFGVVFRSGLGITIPNTLLSLPGPMGELVVYFLSAWLSILSGTRYCVTALRGGLLSLLIEGEYVCPLGRVVVLV